MFDSAESLGKACWADGFDKIVDGVDLKGVGGVFGIGGDHDNFGGVGEGTEEVETGCARHLDIEKEGIRSFFADEFEGGVFGVGFADDLKVAMRSKKLAKALKGEPLVVAEDYTEHGSPCKLRVARTKPFCSVRVKW